MKKTIKSRRNRKAKRLNKTSSSGEAVPLGSRHIAISIGLYLLVIAICAVNILAKNENKNKADWENIWANAAATSTVSALASIPEAEAAEEENPLFKKIFNITQKTPMMAMAEEISEKDRMVAAFLVGIAMKESKFGIYSPKKNGRDCFNYWGYRGKENPTRSGYSCFDSPEHAIKVVGGRIDQLVKQGAKNPAQMIIWKCGSTCAGHSPESVRKWIADVGINFYDIMEYEQVAKK